MNFDVDKSIEILERTPRVIECLLDGISGEWTGSTEGPNSWSTYDVVGHLIHGEKTDWMPRLEIILSGGADTTFPPFDRFAQFKDSAGKSIRKLLEEFRELRRANISALRARRLTVAHLKQTGTHPALGTVTLEQLLATWVVHDLDHIAQIARAMAARYTSDVGPWKEYLKILKQ
jgi:hypothetical protein